MTVGEAGVEFRTRLPGVKGYRRETIVKKCRAGEIPARKFGKEWQILTDWIDEEITDRLIELDNLVKMQMILLVHPHAYGAKKKLRSNHWTKEKILQCAKIRILEATFERQK